VEEGWLVVEADRSIIKRLPAKHGYPAKEEEDAIKKVILQLETFADERSPNTDR
jgi:hypothetical protein